MDKHVNAAGGGFEGAPSSNTLLTRNQGQVGAANLGYTPAPEQTVLDFLRMRIEHLEAELLSTRRLIQDLPASTLATPVTVARRLMRIL